MTEIVQLTEDQHFNLKMLSGAGSQSKETAIPATGKGVCLNTEVVSALIQKGLAAQEKRHHKKIVQIDGEDREQTTSVVVYWLTEAGIERAKFPAEYTPPAKVKK